MISRPIELILAFLIAATLSSVVDAGMIRDDSFESERIAVPGMGLAEKGSDLPDSTVLLAAGQDEEMSNKEMLSSTSACYVILEPNAGKVFAPACTSRLRFFNRLQRPSPIPIDLLKVPIFVFADEDDVLELSQRTMNRIGEQ